VRPRLAEAIEARKAATTSDEFVRALARERVLREGLFSVDLVAEDDSGGIAMIDSMIRLEHALRPFISKLP
jgi:hypothetical protein